MTESTRRRVLEWENLHRLSVLLKTSLYKLPVMIESPGSKRRHCAFRFLLVTLFYNHPVRLSQPRLREALSSICSKKVRFVRSAGLGGVTRGRERKEEGGGWMGDGELGFKGRH